MTGNGVALLALDVDSDGLVDVVTGPALSVHRQTAPRVFSGPASQGIIIGARLAAGDLDGDGVADIAALGSSSGVVVALSDGAGDFTAGAPVATGSTLSAFAIGDADNDGDNDIVTADVGVGLFRNTGAASFIGPQPVTVVMQASDVIVAQLDDGGNDVIVVDRSANLVNISADDGAGFTSAIVATRTDPTAVAVADFDGDLALDFVVGANAGFGVNVHLQDNNGGFPAVPFQPPIPVTDVAVGDLDADGDVDVVFNSADEATLYLTLNQGDGGLELVRTLDTTFLAQQLVIVDVDGDGALDIVATRGSSPVAVFYADP